MGYGVGQTTGQTGVGTTANTTGQTQQAGYGGKGGGQATQPQQTPLAQPSQSSTAQAAPSPVFGGNAFGYNINRLAGRMDPSATLPQAPQASNAQQQAPTGGKGGGYGELAQLPEVQQFLGQFTQPQQPQYDPYNLYGNYGMQQPYSPYGVFAGSPYEATQFAAPTTSAITEQQALNNPYEQQMRSMQDMYKQQMDEMRSMYQDQLSAFKQPQEKDNPYEAQMSAYEQQMQDMQSQYQTQLNALKEQVAKMQDTGAQTYELGPGYEELTNATSTAEQEQIAAEKEKTQEEQKAVEATRPEWQTDKGYEYKTYANFKPEDLVGMSAKEIKALYGQQATQAKTDVTKAQADYNAALKTGNPKLIAGARDNLNAQKAELAKITADQKAASKFLTGAGKTYEAADVRTAREKAAADAKAKAVADAAAKKAAEAAAKKAAADKKKADAAAKKAAKVKKAHGGVIHDGMSKRLKHMLGEK